MLSHLTRPWTVWVRYIEREGEKGKHPVTSWPPRMALQGAPHPSGFNSSSAPQHVPRDMFTLALECVCVCVCVSTCVCCQCLLCLMLNGFHSFTWAALLEHFSCVTQTLKTVKLRLFLVIPVSPCLSPFVSQYHERCWFCFKCIWACERVAGRSVVDHKLILSTINRHRQKSRGERENNSHPGKNRICPPQ